MDLKTYFQARQERIVNIHPDSKGNFYIITDKSDYKQDHQGRLFKFYKGLLNKNENLGRWEEQDGFRKND